MAYPDKLDKSRPVYIAMDYTNNRNTQILNTIVTTLRNGGVTNIKRKEIGPNELYGNISAIYKAGLTNAIIINIANGVDPTNIRELGLWAKYLPESCNNLNSADRGGNDNTGRYVRERGNDAILAFFYDACDFTRTTGTCYNRIKTRNPKTDVPDGGRWPKTSGYKPIDYCRDNQIYVVNQSSNQHNNPENADYTGEKIGAAILSLFGSTGTTNNTNNDDTSNTPDTTTTDTPTVPTTSTTKTITSKTITKEYSTPFYEQIYKLKTDKNGAFNLLHNLPYCGEYKVTMKYGGDKTHNSSTRTVTIQNFSKKSNIFHEELLRTVTITKYSDGSVITNETGNKPDTNHLKRVITTETYENNKLKTTETKTIYMENVLQEKEVEVVTEIPLTPVVTPDTPVTPTTIEGSPFEKRIATVGGVPNVNAMQHGNKKFALVTGGTYTLTENQYRKVFERDSKMMQLNNYKTPRYIAFECETNDKWNVVERTVWNAVEESIYYYMVGHNGAAWPASVTIDFTNHKTSLAGKTVNWKGATCLYHFVSDHQNWELSCGNTSASVCTQVLHNYISEWRFKNEYGQYVGPDTIVKMLKKYNMMGVTTSAGRSTAISWLQAGKPWVWHSDNHYFTMCDVNDAGTRILVSNSAYGSSGIHGSNSGNWGLNTGWNGATSTSYHGGAYGAHVKVSLNWVISESEKTSLNNFFSSMGGAWIRLDSSKQNENLRRQ